ncbi:hypothetical protein RS694_19450 [Rhodoferax saidenbachensis]|uniref:O-GlcNAc transferase C-terminal domain-containing protein n=2 Tax=Rhodoferax saidenbachensis TaxID=1484693 RepID=A0A1P8KEV7_9BURK|nr:hypothetical protein RS694_19450 [Rhodoferax saidenbachensis]
MALGDAYRAKEFQMTAWLSDFDSLRHANAYLFRLAYNDSNDLLLAQEHQFWAETLKPKTNRLTNSVSGVGTQGSSIYLTGQPVAKPKSQKIRIGYWGADFHEHSVRYFARPLLASHSTDRFEVFIYSEDTVKPSADVQAKAYREITKDFYDVHSLSDEALETLLRSHELDILVDLMGHTSANRVHLLKNKFAKIQITGLAYPPTTGHSSIDVKMVDPHIWTAEASQYYTENPLILPESLWCFDPMEEVPYLAEPPVLKNGFVTFGCYGNVAKITPPILACWYLILQKLPMSRLIIQSTVLIDKTTTAAFRKRLVEAGIKEEQIDLKKPSFGAAYWESYQEIDIVLDTYPFNGGTTSCFAAYVGVPLITLSGKSLISRVGRSIMCNLGFPEFAVDTAKNYVERAIEVASDTNLIAKFRREAPQRFKESSLGNAKKFALGFENAIEKLLEQHAKNELGSHSSVPALEQEVLLQRAQMVLYNGNVAAATRILDLCLKHYPDSGGAMLLKCRQLVTEKFHLEALNLLKQEHPKLSIEDAHEALLLEARLNLILNEPGAALQVLQKQALMPEPSDTQKMQGELLSTALSFDVSGERELPTYPAQQSILVLVPCASAKIVEEIERHMYANCIHPERWDITYQRCEPSERLNVYNDLITSSEPGLVLVMQRNLRPWNRNFFFEVVASLEHCELLGCAGALAWRQKDWSVDAPSFKAWGLLRPSQQAQDMFELQIAGADRRKIVDGAVVLDGKFLAFKPALMGELLFDEDMSDSQSLAEEDWSNRLHLSGKRLSIHRNLGLLITESLVSFPAHSTQGQQRLWERLNLDPLSLSIRDYSSISVPIKLPEDGVVIASQYLN